MLCSDSEVITWVGGGGGQFTRLNPINTCTTVSHTKPPFTQFPAVLMPIPHAHLKAGFQCGGLIFKHMYVKVNACTLRSQLQFFTFTYMQSYRSIYICKSDLTHLHMHKQLDTSYQLHMYRQLLKNVACPSTLMQSRYSP